MQYQRLTLKHIIGLAAPHTWVASVFPVLLGAALSLALADTFSLTVFILTLMGMVLLQSSVNTINDYYDFIKGNDHAGNSDDPSDAILVYNKLNPKHVKLLGYLFIAAAAMLGAYPVLRGGFTTLVIAFTGCFVIIAYSAGKRPLSHRPVGELVSGGVMGGLITVATFTVFTGYANSEVYLMSLPLVLAIGLIMMANNTCDIERDMAVGRRTLPVLLGRNRTVALYRTVAVIWMLSIVAVVAVWFGMGVVITVVMLIASTPALRDIMRSTLAPEKRAWCMGAIVKANICFNLSYLAGIVGYIFL